MATSLPKAVGPDSAFTIFFKVWLENFIFLPKRLLIGAATSVPPTVLAEELVINLLT